MVCHRNQSSSHARLLGRGLNHGKTIQSISVHQSIHWPTGQWGGFVGRAGKGVKACVVTPKTGDLACACLVTENSDQLVITSKKGQVIKLPVKNIPQLGRATQGVIIMRFANKGDTIAAATVLAKTGDEEEEI